MDHDIINGVPETRFALKRNPDREWLWANRSGFRFKAKYFYTDA